MAGLFGIADVVFATNEETVMAALAARKPLIAPRRFATLLRDGEEALLADTADPRHVAKKMMRLLADEGLRARLTLAAEGLRDRHSPANAAKLLESEPPR